MNSPLITKLLFLCSLVFCCAAQVTADEKSPEGRFLYAADDDWDWVTPEGSDERAKLSRYGVMPWSALDWAEEGLEEVRGVLLGSSPNIGKYLTIEDLNRLRGPKAKYVESPQDEEKLADLLSGDFAPNIIVLMQDTGKQGRFSDEDVKLLRDFVVKGGRLLALDDWTHYYPVYDEILKSALAAKPVPREADKPEGPDPKLVEKVNELVEQLGSSNFRERTAAVAKLKELGKPAIELAASMKIEDPEVAASIARLKSQFDPKPVDGAEQDTKHQRAELRIKQAKEELEKAGIPHIIEEVLVNAKATPISSLRLTFPVKGD